MASVYTTQLVAAQGFSGTASLEYVVAEGYRVVITCVSIQFGLNATPGGGFVYAGPGAPRIVSYAQLATESPAGLVQEGRWALNAGDGIYIETQGTPSVWVGDFFVTGYNLTLP